jgi:magnesium-transporting ATPase (P-type)
MELFTDVSMIQEAHVGIGIRGLEGTHASQNSDYSIAKFRSSFFFLFFLFFIFIFSNTRVLLRFLKRLLSVHGHHNLYRISSLLKYSFYKNLIVTFIFFFFQFYSGFSLQICLDDYYAMFYNLLFTSFPPSMTAAFDKDVPDWLLEKSPSIYRHNSKARELGMGKVVGWIVLATFQSLGLRRRRWWWWWWWCLGWVIVLIFLIIVVCKIN